MNEVIVIGGGIIGLLTAREFSLNGASVRLLERKRIGCEASWAGGGMLSPLYPWRQPETITALSVWSQAQYPALAESLTAGTGIDPQWMNSGMVVADNPDHDQAENWCRIHGTEFRRLSDPDIKNSEPYLRLSTDHPIYLPQAAQIRNPRLLQALRIDLVKRGVKLLEGCEVIEMVVEKQKVRCVTTKQGAFYSDHFVLAAGAWTKETVKDLIPELQVEPVKGQMILFKTKPGFLSSMIVDHGYYFIPRKDGHILVGSTVERTGFDNRTSEAARIELETFAYSRIPDLKNFPIEMHWAGLRPATPRGIPIICQHPTIGNLSINCGHFRSGIVTAPASARLLLDLVLDRDPIVAAEPYSLQAGNPLG